MRLLREIPEIEPQIQSGELTLSVISQAQSFFRAEAKVAQGLDPAAKREVLSALQGKSTREAERELLSRSSLPASLIQERVRNVSETHVEVKIILSNEAVSDLEKLKGLLAHAHPNLSMGELVALIAKMALERLDPGAPPKRQSAPQKRMTVSQTKKTSPEKSELPAQKPSEPLQTPVSPKRRIPQPLRREVFRRDQSQCTKCGSYFALEADHFPKPFAQGGPNTLENLRALCRSCNQRHAIETYGLEKIEACLNRNPPPPAVSVD